VSKRAYKFGPSEVIAAVESLYEDKVQPIGRILLKRIGERAARAAQPTAATQEEVDLAAIPRVDPKYLRRLCEKCDQLVVEQMDSGEYSVFLAGRPATFVDASSESDPYPAKLWEELAAYFEGLAGEAMFWPSGRFACAQALLARGPPCLAYRSLGEVVHIVQLSVGQKKILGYRNGHLVPYGYSELMEKEQCATYHSPTAASKGTASLMPIASWEETRAGLAWLLARSESGTIQLPNVKRLFRSDLGLELSETALGYARIFELLHDPYMSSVCNLRLEGKNWMVVQLQAQVEPAPMGFDFESSVAAFEAGTHPPDALAEWDTTCQVEHGPAPSPLAFAPQMGTMGEPLMDAEVARHAFRCLSTSPLAASALTLPLPYDNAMDPSQFETEFIGQEEQAICLPWETDFCVDMDGVQPPLRFSAPALGPSFFEEDEEEEDTALETIRFRCFEVPPLAAGPPRLGETEGCTCVDKEFDTPSFASTWDPMEGDLDIGDVDSLSEFKCSCTGNVNPEPCPDPCPEGQGSCAAESAVMDFRCMVKNTFIHMVAAFQSPQRSNSVPWCMQLARSSRGRTQQQ
jgi:hypothetical protein